MIRALKAVSYDALSLDTRPGVRLPGRVRLLFRRQLCGPLFL